MRDASEQLPPLVQVGYCHFHARIAATDTLIWRNVGHRSIAEYCPVMSNPNQLDRLHMRIADLERCIREVGENESSAFSASDRALALAMLEQALRAMRLRVDACHSPPRS